MRFLIVIAIALHTKDSIRRPFEKLNMGVCLVGWSLDEESGAWPPISNK